MGGTSGDEAVVKARSTPRRSLALLGMCSDAFPGRRQSGVSGTITLPRRLLGDAGGCFGMNGSSSWGRQRPMRSLQCRSSGASKGDALHHRILYRVNTSHITLTRRRHNCVNTFSATPRTPLFFYVCDFLRQSIARCFPRASSAFSPALLALGF